MIEANTSEIVANTTTDKRNTDSPPRPWKVTIKATVTKTLEIDKCPPFVESMEDALDRALDEFLSEHNWDGVKVLEASIRPNKARD